MDNPLLYDLDKTMMLFSDAKQGLQEIDEAVKNALAGSWFGGSPRWVAGSW